MSYDARERLEKFYDYIRARLSEASTIASIFSATTMYFGFSRGWNPGQIALAGGIVAAFCSAFLPDNLTRK